MPWPSPQCRGKLPGVSFWRLLCACPIYKHAIKARSAVAQTFIVTKCGGGGYLPTPTSENSVGYSGGINVGKVGHKGGYRFCDLAVGRIGEMFK